MLIEHVTSEKLESAARSIIHEAGELKLWAFSGEMGAGKTTLIKAICKELEVKDEVSSPTFSLVNEYRTQSGQLIYHFDFYRIIQIEEVYDIGYEDYFYSGNLCLMEWPEKIKKLLEGEEYLQVRINKTGELSRNFNVTKLNTTV